MTAEVWGLVVQGGGMRGIYSAGAMGALAEAGLAGRFAHIFASSSGAINAAYLLSGQTDLVAAGYAEHLNGKSPFIRYWRLNRIVDIDYLVDTILKHSEFPLDVEAVIDSTSILHVIVTDFFTAEPVEMTNKNVGESDASGELMYELFRATSALPLFYGRVVEINGGKYVDGGISDAIPLFRAIEAGCTDIIVVTTRDPRYRRGGKRGIARLLGRLALANYPRPLSRKLLNEDRLFNKTMRFLQAAEIRQGNPRITLISPSDESRLAARTTRRRDKLWDCAQMGREDVFRALEVSVP